MVDIVTPSPWRATDADGNPIAAAQAFFYRSGTDTLETVYANEGGTIAHASPLVADSDGVFPQAFNTSGNALKIVVRDPLTLASIPGGVVDPAPQIATTVGGAAGVSFAPTALIPETNLQAAVERVLTDILDRRTGALEGLVSGLAGQGGNVATWNAEGDLVDGGHPGVPIGAGFMFMGSVLPFGYLWVQNQTLLIADYPLLFDAIGTRYGGDGIADFVVGAPEDYFHRFWHDGSSNVRGSLHEDEIKSHTHGLGGDNNFDIGINDSFGIRGPGGNSQTSAFGGTETAPKHFYEAVIVRAY